jgi:hypothetical protein
MTGYPNDQGNASGAIPVYVADPATGYIIKPNADGSITVGGFSGNITINGNVSIVQPSSGNVSNSHVALNGNVTTLFAGNVSVNQRRVRNTDGNLTVYLRGNATVGYPLGPGAEYVETLTVPALTATSPDGNVTVAIEGFAP